MPLDFVSNTDEKVPITLAPKTAGGRPAPLDGAAVLSITSGNATVQPATEEELAANPNHAGHIVSEDTAGSSEWKVTADADMGEGVVHIEESGTYTYSAAQASNLGVAAGTPVLK